MDNKSSKIELREFGGGQKQKIIEAVGTKNVNQLIAALQETNQALTGLESGHFSAGAGIDGLRKELTDFFQDSEKYGDASVVVYLGDGGQSRIVVTTEESGDVSVELTDNSTDEVKEAWENLQ